MFNRRLLLLATTRHIGVLDWRPGHLRWLGEFAASPAGVEAFRQCVTQHAHLPALVVADTVDEDYRSELLPHVQGRARDELLARRLKQVFRNARFTGAWRQARDSAGRRDDRYLLATLTDADWLTPWLAVLQRAGVPLAGIAPLALAYQHLLSKLRIAEPHVLLASRLNNSLRLSYYHAGQLRFSRLVGSDTPTQLPGNAADEIAKTQLYLTGQRILPREARLHVLLLDPSGQLDSAQAPLDADPAFSTRRLDLSGLARALRIPDDFLAATPEIAPLAAIAGESVALNLAPPELLQRHTEFSWRRRLHLAAGGVAALGVAVTAATALQARSLDDTALALQAQARAADARHAAVVERFPVLATRPEQLGQTLALATRLKRAPLDIGALFVPLGQALAAHPDIVLESVALEDAADGGARVTLTARLAAFDGNYRAAMAGIDRFVARLGASRGVVAVERLSNPVDTAPTATLSGGTTGENPPDATRFSLGVQVRRS